MKKIIGVIFSLVLLSVMYTTVLAATGTNPVKVPEVYYRLRNVKSNHYLDCAGYTNDSNIRQMAYASWQTPQKFLIVHTWNYYHAMHPYESMEMVPFELLPIVRKQIGLW